MLDFVEVDAKPVQDLDTYAGALADDFDEQQSAPDPGFPDRCPFSGCDFEGAQGTGR